MWINKTLGYDEVLYYVLVECIHMHWEGKYANSFIPYIWNAFVGLYKAGFSVYKGGNIHGWAKSTT